jgi:succinate dehydrogenase/fumarate reductase flavoprotein subunit
MTSDRQSSAERFDIELTADVLVIGGGPAGVWAALAAVEQGASAVIAEKGYLGTSGPFGVGANTGIYYIKPDDPVQRDAIVLARQPIAYRLSDPAWGYRVYDQSYVNLEAMAKWGYEWPHDSQGREDRGSLRGPTIMAFLRAIAEKHGVTVLDHSPALELLLAADGAAAGARGVNKQKGQTWQVRAGSVVIATGGTSFLSGVAGDRTHTGDGYLLAAEAGADFSGMEFTGQYHAAPTATYLTRGAYRSGVGTYYDNNGDKTLEGRQMVNAILETGGAWDQLDRTDDPVTQDLIRKTHALAFQYFERQGIDPFTERYSVSFVLEGTMRAGGGIAIDDELATRVPGLFAGGDVTSREKLTGGGPPGGGPASAWAFATGYFAGRSAAAFAKGLGRNAMKRSVSAAGRVGLEARERREASPEGIIAAVREEMLPLEKNYWRTGPGMTASLARFDSLWRESIPNLAPLAHTDAKAGARDRLRVREAVALLAAGRWIYASANERTESRGLHRRTDFPRQDPAQDHHLICGGLDGVWVRTSPHVNTLSESLGLPEAAALNPAQVAAA